MFATKLRFRIARIIPLLIAALALLAFAMGAQPEDLTVHHPRVKKVIEVQETVTPTLMAMEDVIGTAVAQDDDGEITMVIYVNLEGKNPAKAYKDLPREIAGVRARPEITEPFRAMVGKPGAPRIPQGNTDTSHPAWHFWKLEI